MPWKPLGALLAGLLLLPTTALASSGAVLGAEEATIVLQNHDPGQCIVWENCQALEGVSLVDIDISDEMDQAHDVMEPDHGDAWDVKATVKNVQATDRLTQLRLCWYNANHGLIGCQDQRDDTLNAELPKDATDVRILLLHGADAEIYFRMIAVAR